MVVEQMPEFPGGMAACMKFLGENIKYPEVAHKNGVQGRVILQLVVETDGGVSNVKVVRSVSPEIDAEAVRVVGLMPKWKPGMQRGKAVRVRYTIPITFSLDKPKDSADDEVAIAVNPSSEGSAGQQVFQVVEQMPEFPGGMSECLKFLTSNVRYPEVAHTNEIQGRVIVQFVVEKDGSITSPVVVRGVDPSLDAEAIRVIGLMPKWKPGMQRGQAVSVKYTIPVTFRLQGNEQKEGDVDGYTMNVKADREAMGLITVRGGNFHSTQPVLIMIDGVKSDSTAMAKLTAPQIKAISVLKDKDAIAQYGEEGKNGVIVITTRKE